MRLQYLSRPTDTRGRARIGTNNTKPPEAPGWQSYRRSVSGANCTFVALWTLAQFSVTLDTRRDSRVICAFPPSACAFIASEKVAKSHSYNCPENHPDTKTRKSITFVSPPSHSPSLSVVYSINQFLKRGSSRRGSLLWNSIYNTRDKVRRVYLSSCAAWFTGNYIWENEN